MAYTVVGIFDSLTDATPLIDDLLRAGVEREQISLISQKGEGEPGAPVEHASGSLGTTTATGALFGGIGGLLIGLGVLAIPGIGPILAAGPIAAALVGAGVGATGGALVGALRDMGVPEEEAGFFAETVRRGSTLVSVTADDSLADTIAEVLDKHGASDVGERRAAFAREGWDDYDEKAGPYAGPISVGSMGATVVREPSTRHQRVRRYRK